MPRKTISQKEHALRSIMGNMFFDEGMSLCESGSVSGPKELDGDIRLFRVSCPDAVHRVIQRHKIGFQSLSYDCDCGDGLCCHIAATMILLELPFDDHVEAEMGEDDTETMEHIRGKIESMDQKVSSNPVFDEEAWSYEGEYWYEERYGSEGVDENHEIAYNVAAEVYDEIMNTLNTPDSIVIMLNALANYSGEYTGDEPEKVIQDNMKEVEVRLHYASPEAVADCIQDSKEYACWILDVAGSLGDGVLGQAVFILESRGFDSKVVRKAREMLS